MSEPVMKELLRTIPQIGAVTWIGIRPGRDQAVIPQDEVMVDEESGIGGDRYNSTSQKKRQVTLMQEEHLKVVESILGKPIDPTPLRRNIMVRGINLLSLHNQRFRVGDVLLECTGYCYPCSKMEAALGKGGYNAMRGHGGITAMVIESGRVRIGDHVELV